MKHTDNINTKRLRARAGLLVVLAVVLSNCGGGGSGLSYSYGGGTPASSTVQVVACPAGGTTDISIVDLATGFSPAGVTVPVDTTVKWTNADSIQHTVTSSTVPLNGTFDATLNPGISVCLKFTVAGAFNYHCSIHPSMTGLVTVQ